MDPLHSLTLGAVLAEHRRSRPRATAVVDGEVRLSWPELDARVARVAAALATRGVGPGGRVLWFGQNSFRLLELVLATGRLGAMCCPANWRLGADELAFQLDDLDPAVVVWQAREIGATAQDARGRAAASSAAWWCHDASAGADAYEEVVASVPSEPDPRVDESTVDADAASPVLALYTAAFEGRPHAAMLSHDALIGQAMVMGRAGEVDASSVFLNSGPMFHVANWWWTLATFLHGGTNVFTPRVDAEELCRLIEAERCTSAYLVGPTFDEICAANADGRHDLSSLRSHRGRPEWNAMTTEDTSPWGRAPGGYGQTELVGMATLNLLGADGDGSHGRPSPLVQLRIVDPDDHEVPVGEVGEIVVRGPLVMHGYWNRPDENARRVRGGWHHTRDLGRREPDGTVTFVGPATRMIKSAAENIYPVEVERCIVEHPGVAECAVIGVPDPEWTQSVKAVVVPVEDATVTAEEIVEHCRRHIASYKKPRAVEIVDALPRVGWSVDYEALDARFGGGGYPGGTNRSA